jgi:hypothetical protein
MTYAALLIAGVVALWVLLRRRPDPDIVGDLEPIARDITGRVVDGTDADIDAACGRLIDLHEGRA